jgi:hypothetical protein
MATAGGRLLQHIAKNAAVFKSVLMPLRHDSRTNIIIRQAWTRASQALEGRLQPLLKPQAIPVRVRVSQPLHPLARLRQNASHGRWYTTRSQAFQRTREALRHYTTFPASSSSATPGLRYNRAAFLVSRTATTVNRLSGRSPFAHTLRPNLTGGTLNRTAGGYTLGGGKLGGQRYFSNGPAAPAQVVQNVSQAVRAFWLTGSKAQYDGVNGRGNKQYRTVSATKHTVMRKIAGLHKATPGSHVDFRVNPTITALAGLNGVAGYPTWSREEQDETAEPQTHLNSTGLLDILQTDFSRSLRDLSAILADIKRLASLGDLPITYENTPSGTVLRIHFPGTDGETVDRLCEEMNITRGIVTEDADFDAFVGSDIALMFPFAPSKTASLGYHSSDDGMFETVAPAQRDSSNWNNMPIEDSILSETEHVYDYADADEDYSMHSEQDIDLLSHSESQHDDKLFLEESANPWRSQTEGYGSGSSESWKSQSHDQQESDDRNVPLEYQDFEGIRQFIELCDGAATVSGRTAGVRR